MTRIRILLADGPVRCRQFHHLEKRVRIEKLDKTLSDTAGGC